MAKITQLSQLDLNAEYSYADYLTWLFDETVELIKGKILMNPAPNFNHHYISKNFLVDIGYFLKGKPCQVFHAPFDVRLYDRKKSIVANQDIFTVVQPDLSVICDSHKLDSQGCLGAPDWIIEIISPSSAKKIPKLNINFIEKLELKNIGWFILMKPASRNLCWMKNMKNINWLKCFPATIKRHHYYSPI